MDLDLELDVIEREPTVLEYARFHGICSDYTQEKLRLDCVTLPSDEAFDLDLRDPKDAPTLTNPADELMKERLAVSREAAILLKAVFSLQESPPDLHLIPDRRKHIRKLKQEVPILRTDNELDMLQFGSSVEPSFADLKLPFEPMNDEHDEGLQWPSKYSTFPERCMEQVKDEKLGVSREVLLYLQDAIRDKYRPEDSEMIRQESSFVPKNAATRPITPPLLPQTPPLTPYIPSSPGNHLQLISDDSNSTATEAKELEEQIMNADALRRHGSDSSDIILMDMLDTGKSDSTIDHVNSPPTKRKASDLRIEGPLTPNMFSESPAKKLKRVSFAEMLVEYIPFVPWTDNPKDPESKASGQNEVDPDLPSNFEDGGDIITEEDDYAFFQDIIEPAAREMNWRVENEKLSEADTTRRMEVPHLDFQLPTAPWNEFTRDQARSADGSELDAQARFLQWVKRNHMRSVASWHGVSELERRLPLAPFSYQAAKVTVEEKLHGEEVLAKMLTDVTKGEVVTSSTDLWKRDGLRIVDQGDEDEDDDMLEPADFEEPKPKDMASLIKKRKLELQESADDQRLVHRAKPPTTSTVNKDPNPRNGASESHHWKQRSPIARMNTPSATVSHTKDHKPMPGRHKAARPAEPDNSLMFGGKFSATSALDSFMSLHGMSAKVRVPSKDKPAPERPSALPLPSPIRPAKEARNHLGMHSNTGRPDFEAAHQPLELPPLPEDMPPCSFVISSTLLQRRSLSRQIENLYTTAEFVSRDFESQHIVGEEADLIVSPSTGLIVTTLQQLKQRALPGQPDCSPVKARMLALQNLYERLVVVVSEGLSREWEDQTFGRRLDSRDQEVVAEYENVASQLHGEVLIRYVPGGDKALARTIVYDMARFGLRHGSKDIGDIKLLPDQTTWELFLRRAGLNAFAAQAIIALLKDPYDWNHASYHSSNLTFDTLQTCGLQTFILMSPVQRVQHFQAHMGGSRVLERVSGLLDETWLSAAHGFHI